MDEIEEQVVLPADATSMEQYSRYYAKDENGVVEAAYVMHDPAWVEDVREMCAEEKRDEFPCADGKPHLAASGGRKWLAHVSELPIPSGGGCATIRFSYHPVSRKLSPAECNGDY